MLSKPLSIYVKFSSVFVLLLILGSPLSLSLGRAASAACNIPVRIMPLGDSITRGAWSTNVNGYRRPLYQALTSNGFNVDFVGGLQDGQDDFDRDHEGHSGWHAEDPMYSSIAPNVYDFLVSNPADVVLLHIGTNDINTGTPDAAEVGDILNEIDRYSKNIVVVLTRIINRDPYSPETTQYNDDVEAMARNRIKNGDKIILVDMESALSYPDDLADGIHPNDSGYEKMANVWYSALSQFLPTCPVAPTITSKAMTIAVVGQPYSYDVDAGGAPAPTYTLTQAPAGMSIDFDQGLITWTPKAAGIFNVTVEAGNWAGIASQNYTITVSGPVPVAVYFPAVYEMFR